MSMIKKSIAITAGQDEWLKAQIETGQFGNESELVRELILERQLREEATPAEIEAIRAALISAEQSGFSDCSLAEIREAVRQRRRSKATHSP